MLNDIEIQIILWFENVFIETLNLMLNLKNNWNVNLLVTKTQMIIRNYFLSNLSINSF